MSAPAATLTKLLAWRPGGYLRASGVLFGWLTVRTLAQTALFVLVARTLGAEGYGSLITVMAVATFFSPLAGLGGQSVMLRDGARDPQALPVHLGDALRLWAISVVPLCTVAFLACLLLVPTALPAYAMAAIVLADVAGASLLELLARTWQAVQRMGGFGGAMAGLIVVRLVVFCALLGVAAPTPAQWAAWYGAITTIYVLVTAVAVARTFGRPRVSETSFAHLAVAGFPFAFAGSAMRVQAEANKPILARLDTIAGAGVFSAAQRVTDLLLFPLQALLEALFPHAYRAAPSVRSIFKLGVVPLGIGAGGALGLAMGAELMPLLLGNTYADAVTIMRLMAFLPCLFVVRWLLTVVIAGSGLQRHFYGVYGLGALAGVCSTVALAPSLGMIGAAAAAYVSELAMIGFQSFLLARQQLTPK